MRKMRKESKEMQRGEVSIWGGGEGKKESMEEGRKKTTEEGGGKNNMHQNLSNTAKAVLNGKLRVTNAYVCNEKGMKTNELSIILK